MSLACDFFDPRRKGCNGGHMIELSRDIRSVYVYCYIIKLWNDHHDLPLQIVFRSNSLSWQSFPYLQMLPANSNPEHTHFYFSILYDIYVYMIFCLGTMGNAFKMINPPAEPPKVVPIGQAPLPPPPPRSLASTVVVV